MAQDQPQMTQDQPAALCSSPLGSFSLSSQLGVVVVTTNDVTNLYVKYLERPNFVIYLSISTDSEYLVVAILR